MASLSADEIDILRWWTPLLRKEISRVCVPKLLRPEVIIYTDAATSTRIVASLVIDVPDFDSNMKFRNLWDETSDPQWETTFISTTYIYGLELLAILATIFLEGDFLDERMSPFTSTIQIVGDLSEGIYGGENHRPNGQAVLVAN